VRDYDEELKSWPLERACPASPMKIYNIEDNKKSMGLKNYC
jgi:hypothetical protein